MNLLEELIAYNKDFVSKKKYKEYTTTKYPNKRMVILTCMDTRLVELLPKALNVKNGDVKIIKNAGALITHPFGSIMRSLLVGVYELQADEIFVIGHHDCGMSGLKADSMIEKMKQRGVKEEILETLAYSGIEFKEWLKGFENVNESVAHSVDVIKNHPLLPQDIPVHGLVIDPTTGKLDLVMNGYEQL
ncbi:carbonic anhydrase [Bacillus aquiflavi]|uniref:carbonic anhydrase n=1 Tax=Bacillus aquiflavi TaxID=2672567 RepID=A0A6B3VUJ7_9BACI|nr:carbonic anhydrase [Bacillus aquiflavi]MBA4537414.1 carbonic anhydrase [Bacillus aquiflavi]NEY81669.1 carbonic anhydrase [Bacillus aquiflavi]UAC47642.1 carbonic anhydrase [Bacillus aquiflavi]